MDIQNLGQYNITNKHILDGLNIRKVVKCIWTCWTIPLTWMITEVHNKQSKEFTEMYVYQVKIFMQDTSTLSDIFPISQCFGVYSMMKYDRQYIGISPCIMADCFLNWYHLISVSIHLNTWYRRRVQDGRAPHDKHFSCIHIVIWELCRLLICESEKSTRTVF